MLIRDVELDGNRVDMRIRDGLVEIIADRLESSEGEAILDGRGGAILPGLHDHHIHLNATAAALSSVRCGPPYVETEQQLIVALNDNLGEDWLRGIGYHPSVAGEIDCQWLDRNGPRRPIRIQHRSGRLWIFNSRAMALLDLAIPKDGRLLDGDMAVRAALGNERPGLVPLIQQLCSFGITGVTEVTPGNDLADFEHYLKAAQPLNLCVMGGAGLHNFHGPAADFVGPLKLHNHDHNLPALDDLAESIRVAHSRNRAVAIHCVTRAELMLSLAAIEEAGPHPGDRIEHAAIADEAAIEWIARLGLTVVTQPHFVAERRAVYLNDVEAEDFPHLWRLKSFLDAGIKLAAGSDAPFGDYNPWKAMASAVRRPEGFGQDEATTPEEALGLYTKPVANAGGNARKIAVGEQADLCLLDRTWSRARANLSEVKVKATWIAGALVYQTNMSTRPQSSAV